MHLVMFDVDGTLVDSLAAEAELYPVACAEALGMTRVSGDWRDYHNPTDRGIVEQLVRERSGRPATEADHTRVEARFVELLQAHHADCALRPVPGASAAFAEVLGLPDTMVAIATAGWRTSALFKLSCCGIDAAAVPLAAANDATYKREIMRVSLGRALRQAGLRSFASTTYVGDSNMDRRAAAELGFRFIAMDTAGWVSDSPVRFTDYRDRDAFVRAVRAAR